MNGLPPDFKEQLLSTMEREPSLTRAAGRTRQWIWLLVGFALVLAASLMRGVPRPSMDRPSTYLVIFGTSTLAVALLVTASVLAAKSWPKSTLRAMVVTAPLLLATVAIAAGVPMAPSPGWAAHAMCLSLYAMLGGLLLAIGLLGVRPLDPVTPTTTGAALGAAVGTWVTLAVSLQCPGADPKHVLIAHVAPIVAMVAIGAVLGTRMLTRRATRSMAK